MNTINKTPSAEVAIAEPVLAGASEGIRYSDLMAMPGKPLTGDEKEKAAALGLNSADYVSAPDAREAMRELEPEARKRARKATLEGTMSDEDLERVKGIFSLKAHTQDDPSTLIGDRWLCRGGGALLVAPTGVGKSVFTIQLALSLALGRETLGLVPRAPMTVLIIQAENDEGDVVEARDGVALGLGLTDEERNELDWRVECVQEDTRTGDAFIEFVASLTETFRPDLLIIDPAFAYLGGDASSQTDVGRFLRTGLNPILRQWDCAAIIVHHTNKPLREKAADAFRAGDMAYLGAGSAEWCNWARAVLAVSNVGSHSIFKLVAGKRGKRLGWKDENGAAEFSRYIAHAKSKEEGGEGIFWRVPSREEVAEEIGAGAGRKPQTKNNPAILADIIALDGRGEPMTHGALKEAAVNRGILANNFKNVLPRAIANGLIQKDEEGRYTLPLPVAKTKARPLHNDP